MKQTKAKLSGRVGCIRLVSIATLQLIALPRMVPASHGKPTLREYHIVHYCTHT